MVVQDVINAVSNDVRQVLSAAAPDNAIFITWVDRIQKDAIHTSLWNYLIQQVQTIAVTVDTSNYVLTTPARRLILVYDRTFDRILTNLDSIAYPTPKGDAQEPTQASMPQAMLTAATMDQWPEYYRRIGDTKIYLFPAPQKAVFNGTYEIHYESFVPDLVNLSDTLLIPNDGLDLVVAGVNMMATQYLKFDSEASSWASMYQSMKNGKADL